MARDWFDRLGFLALLAFVSALQFSIALANMCLALALLMWVLGLATRRTFDAPAFFVGGAGISIAAPTLFGAGGRGTRLTLTKRL